MKPIKEMIAAMEAIAVMEAHARGEKIEQYCLGKWVDVTIPLWNWSSCSYRIAPTPKLRAWKPEEVPMPCVLRNKTTGNRFQVLAVILGGLYCVSNSANAFYPFSDLIASSEHSLDGGKTWLPCGVMEVEK